MILYGCTSATLTHGPDFDRGLAKRIKSVSGAETVTAAGSLVHALQTLNVTRIGFASPYVSAINDLAISFLAETGVETVVRSEVSEPLDNYGQGNLDPEAVFELAKAADHAEAEAVLLSCTDMRSVEIINRLETALGKPVITSNQTMIFQARQLAGIDDPLLGYGRLFDTGPGHGG